jgi:hypothetical protein
MSNWADIVTAMATVGTFAAVSAAFLFSHRPMLAVSIKKCEYSEPEATFKGQIRIANHGTAIADQVDLTFTFGGTNALKKIDKIVIPPGDKHKETLSLSMGPDAYRLGQTKGNTLNAVIQGSYKGLLVSYRFNARLDYDPQLKRFVPIKAW